MSVDECKFCQSYSVTKEANTYYCSACNNNYYSCGKKFNNNIKNFSNKEAHFKNIIKNLSNVNTSDLNYEFINEMQNYIKTNNLDYNSIDTQFINSFSKKNTVKTKKNYILYHSILCYIKNQNPIFNKDAINIITIIFYDFAKFLCKYNKIGITISYQLLINNILNIFDIDNNLNPTMKNNLKDKKWDIWSKYVVNVCERYLEDKKNTTNILYHYNSDKELYKYNKTNIKRFNY